MNTALLIVCEILLPLLSDWTKLPFDAGHVEAWEANIVRLAGGATYLGVVRGAWMDGDGRLVSDMSHLYRFAVEADKVAAVRALAAAACVGFEQQCIYLQIAGKAELVPAPVTP